MFTNNDWPLRPTEGINSLSQPTPTNVEESIKNNALPEVSLPSKPISAQKVLTLETLTLRQRERFIVVSQTYSPETSLKIMSAIAPTGFNTWTSVYTKIDLQLEPVDDQTAQYFSHIRSQIKLNITYGMASIITIVSSARKAFKLKQYQKNIFKDCLMDFLRSHIAIPIFEDKPLKEKEKASLIGYRPVVDLTDYIS